MLRNLATSKFKFRTKTHSFILALNVTLLLSSKTKTYLYLETLVKRKTKETEWALEPSFRLPPRRFYKKRE
jgi:hypothetical protein